MIDQRSDHREAPVNAHVPPERRAIAWLVDLALLAAACWVLGIPTDQWTLRFSLAMVLYMLVRDIGGASPGKLVAGLEVVLRGGEPASPLRRVVRNLPLALTPALALFEPMRHGIGLGVALLPSAIEQFLVLARRERLGDRWAGTMVVARARRE